MYQVHINHLRSRIGALANKQREDTEQGKDIAELCAISDKLLSFIEELSSKRSG
jgi:hypothetical protein